METHPVTTFFRQFNIKSIHSIEHDLKILKRTYDMPTSLEIIKLAILKDGQHKIEAKEANDKEKATSSFEEIEEIEEKNDKPEASIPLDKSFGFKEEKQKKKRKRAVRGAKNKYEKMNRTQLQAELRKRGKTVTGNKDVLIERLLNE